MRSKPIPLLPLKVPDTRSVTVEHIQQQRRNVRNSVHRHDYSELFVFAHGSGTHMIDLQVAPIAPPCLHVVEVGRVHQVVRSADAEGFVIEFTAAALVDPGRKADADLLFAATHDQPWTPISDEQYERLVELLRMLEQELEEHHTRRDRILENYLGIILAKCADWIGGASATRSGNTPGDILNRFKALVETGFLDHKRVQDYAGELALSSGHLNDLVHDRLGTTASAIINDRVLLEAKRLLLHSELSLKEVGFTLGMKDPAYFSRWFAKAEDCSPKVYRDRIRQLYQ